MIEFNFPTGTTPVPGTSMHDKVVGLAFNKHRITFVAARRSCFNLLYSSEPYQPLACPRFGNSMSTAISAATKSDGYVRN